MKNDVLSEGMQRLTLTAPGGGVVSGKFYQIGSLQGVAVSTEIATALFTLKTKHVVEYACPTAEVYAEGDALYYDVADDEMTSDADTGTNKLAGYAYRVKAGGPVLCQIRLNESKGA